LWILSIGINNNPWGQYQPLIPLWNHTTTYHKEEEQLEDRRNVDENSCNSGDGTDQRVQSLMFMMIFNTYHKWCTIMATYRGEVSGPNVWFVWMVCENLINMEYNINTSYWKSKSCIVIKYRKAQK
jgi:hypothetical protein